MTYIQSIIGNPWVIFIIMVGTPLGIIISSIFFIKSKIKTSLKFCIGGIILIKDFIQKINGLTIKYLNNDIKTLIVENIVFWNNGNEPIRHNDIPENEKFSILVSDEKYNIYNASIIYTTNLSNNISINLSENGKELNIDFEYMDKHDGFILQIFHDGTDLTNINGSIIGFGKIRKGFSSLKSPLAKFIAKHINENYRTKAEMISYLIFGIFYFLSLALWIIIDVFISSIIMVILICLYFIFSTKVFATKIPKNLKKNFNNFDF